MYTTTFSSIHSSIFNEWFFRVIQVSYCVAYKR